MGLCGINLPIMTLLLPYTSLNIPVMKAEEPITATSIVGSNARNVCGTLH